MKITPVKTVKVKAHMISVFQFLDQSLVSVPDRSIVCITSKVISLCEGAVAAVRDTDKVALIEQESELYLPPETNPYNIVLTIKRNLLIPTAGIDESNADGYYVLWPKNPQETANNVRAYLKKKFQIENLGIIITDSRTMPLRWGTMGACIAYSGFAPLNNYIGKPDLFGRTLHVTKSNIADGVAGAAVVAMGEGDEQTPLAVVEDIPFVRFQNNNPTKKELDAFNIGLDEDLYSPLLKSVAWKKGKGG